MGRGRHRAAPGVAVAALTGVVLAGGASFAAPFADAAPAPAPAPKPCTIGALSYLLPAPKAGVPRAEAAPATNACRDAITDHVLEAIDVKRYGLKPVTAQAPKPVTAAEPVTQAPTTTTPAPARTPPATTPPATTTTGPAANPTAPSVGTTTTTAPGRPAGTADAAPPAAAPSPTTSPTSTLPAGGAVVRAAGAASAVTPPGGTLARTAVVPPGPQPAGLGAPAGGAVPAPAPIGEPVPGEPLAIGGVDPASYLTPLDAPGAVDLPGDATVLQALGGDSAGVTTSSRVSALGLDGLHRSGGVPAVLGVIIMSGLGGFALRHRILSRLRSTVPAGGPAPEPEAGPRDDEPRGRHAG